MRRSRTSVFAGRSVFVTGAGGGLGRAFCLAAARRGAVRVVATDIRHEAAAETAERVRAAGVDARSVWLDVTDGSAFSTAIAEAWAEPASVDVLINNAGFAVAGESRDLSLEDWRRVLEVNLLGVVHGVVATYPRMAERGAGRIVNVASLAGLLPVPGSAPYCASKHAVVGLSKTLRIEGERLGVRVHALCPGYIESDIFRHAKYVGVTEEGTLKAIPVRFRPVGEAVDALLDGVERERALVVYPGYARWLFRLERYLPSTALRLQGGLMKAIRRGRRPPAGCAD